MINAMPIHKLMKPSEKVDALRSVFKEQVSSQKKVKLPSLTSNDFFLRSLAF